MTEGSDMLVGTNTTEASGKPEATFKRAVMRHGLMVMALILVCALPLALHSGSLATETLVFALAALGCNLLLGYTGLLSFGQGIFFGLGSYTVGIVLTKTPLPLPAALACAIAAAAVGAACVGWLSIRQRGTYFVMLTLAFGQMFYFAAYALPEWTGGDNGLLDIPRPALSVFGKTLMPLGTAWTYYGFVAAVFLATFLIMTRLSRSIFGHTLLAIRENEARAAAVGYDVKRFKLLAFVISGGVTGLAGALHALMTGIAPLTNIDYHMSESILVMTVIGGTGNLFASVIGAVFYVLFADWLSTLWPRWLLLLGLALMAVSLFMQGGLWGLAEKLASWWRRAPESAHTANAPGGGDD
jgi:branched-chain amino acid transport system permease protein